MNNKELSELLTKAKDLLKDEVTKISYETWIKDLEIESAENGNIVLVANTVFQKDSIMSRYYDLFKNTFRFLTNKEWDINVVLKSDDSAPIEETTHFEQLTTSYVNPNSNLNPKYTFDTFVVGNNNRFAHAAALAVAEAPAKSYNPLFVYGGSGLGKTHLMHSIAHYIIEHNSSLNVLYVTSEDFTNEVINSIQHKKQEELRSKYRNIDVLLVDDIQFVIGKESTQQEFFHTFNALYNSKKQIILSSDKPPKELDVLEERLRSRFSWGLPVDIQPPNYETKVAILRKRAELDNIYIDDEIFDYIATHIKSNIRDLEGALNKIKVYSKLNKKPIDLELSKIALQDLIDNKTKQAITPELIMQTVAEHFNIQTSDIISKKRSHDIAYPRQICMYARK